MCARQELYFEQFAKMHHPLSPQLCTDKIMMSLIDLLVAWINLIGYVILAFVILILGVIACVILKLSGSLPRICIHFVVSNGSLYGQPSPFVLHFASHFHQKSAAK
jgi:hypothetical protein